ncbi:MAG: agmatine deiminase family protein [Flavobacteriales bacterium]|nr:agmatine deiminase family protein [Flavobacteriales bacterium]
MDEILGDFQGLSEYIKMTALPYDIINHIDMHMKLLDEETLLVGEYPEGTADGPQINANIDYVLNNFNSHFETPYKVERIPMPDSESGLYPDDNPAGYYRTYTNGVFVNNTFIYPSYREEYDTTAARIYSELLPGYNLVPIDCDDQPDLIIAAAGAIHCITHSVGVNDPLLIVHQPLADTDDDVNPYLVEAEIEHRSGIASASLHWRLEGDESYETIPMDFESGDTWSGFIPAQPVESVVEYYMAAAANNGKTQTRPIVAPEGYWDFKVTGAVVGTEQIENLKLNPIYPNPANGLVSIPLMAETPEDVYIYITDMTGRKLVDVFRGRVHGDQRISHFVNDLASGSYLVVAEGSFGRKATPLVVVNR